MNILVNHVDTSSTGQPLKYYYECAITLTYNNFHVYKSMGFPSKAFFICSQILKLHRQFSHQSAEKLYKLLRIARPGQKSTDTIKVRADLLRKCEHCQNTDNVQ